MTPLTDEQLNAIRARVEAATPGEKRWMYYDGELWLAQRDDDGYHQCGKKVMWGECFECGPDSVNVWTNGTEADKELVRCAFEDIPALLAEIDRLKAENEQLRAAMPKPVKMDYSTQTVTFKGPLPQTYLAKDGETIAAYSEAWIA